MKRGHACGWLLLVFFGTGCEGDPLPSGRTTTLDGVATVTFPENVLPVGTEVEIHTTTNPSELDFFDFTAAVYLPGARASRAVEVLLTETAPQPAEVAIQLVVPSDLSIPAGYAPQAFAREMHVGDLDRLDLYQMYPSTFDGRALSFQLPSRSFRADLDPTGRHRAVFMVAAVPLPAGANPELPKLRRPLSEELSLRSAWHADKHRAIDLRADGVAVLSLGTGRVIDARDSRFDDLGMLDDRKTDNGGWGGTVAIDHGALGVIRYAHLKKGSLTVAEGQTVSCGQVLGRAGNTGHSFGAHLHLEWTRPGGNKVDALPRFDLGYQGTFQFEQRSATDFAADGSVKLDLCADDATSSTYVMTGTVTLSSSVVFGTLICEPEASRGPVTQSAVVLHKKASAPAEYENYDLELTGSWETRAICEDTLGNQVPIDPFSVPVRFATYPAGECTAKESLSLSGDTMLAGDYTTTCFEGTTRLAWIFSRRNN